MPIIVRIILSGLIGTIVCAILSFLMFFLVAVFDNQQLIEAFAYGLIVGMIGAFIGGIIGLAVGIGDLSLIGGGVFGFFTTLIVVMFYVYSTGESFGVYGYFLSESRIIIVVFSLPTILTGVITALLKKLIYKTQGRNA